MYFLCSAFTLWAALTLISAWWIRWPTSSTLCPNLWDNELKMGSSLESTGEVRFALSCTPWNRQKRKCQIPWRENEELMFSTSSGANKNISSVEEVFKSVLVNTSCYFWRSMNSAVVHIFSQNYPNLRQLLFAHFPKETHMHPLQEATIHKMLMRRHYV